MNIYNTVYYVNTILILKSKTLKVSYSMKLLDQVRDVMRRKHYSIRTEQAYVDWMISQVGWVE